MLQKRKYPKSFKGLSKSKIRVDVLINNAAINPKVGKKLNPAKKIRFENLSPEDWNQELDVGLKELYVVKSLELKWPLILRAVLF